MLNHFIMSGIIFFDGVCNFCNRTVHIILKHDKTNYFQFATTQSNAALKMIEQFGLEENVNSSVMLFDNAKLYTKSDAVVLIAKHLSGWPSIFSLLKFIPKPLRDFGYNLIAKNRYRLFGKKDKCMVPDAAILEKFLQ